MTETAVSDLKSLKKEELTRTSKYILPLVVAPTMFGEGRGFVNTYTMDVNRPWMADKLLLVYEYATDLGRSEHLFNANLNYYDKYYMSVDNISYVVYAFNLSDEIKDILQTVQMGIIPEYNKKQLQDIIQFWPNYTFIVAEKGINYTPFVDTIPVEDLLVDPIEYMLGLN